MERQTIFGFRSGAGLLMLGMAAASCTAVLGIDKPYREANAGAGGAGGTGTSDSSVATSGSSSGSASAASSSSTGTGGSGGGGDGATCNAIHQADNQAPNGVYTLDPDGPGGAASFKAYCEMLADGGGWTLALKIDGTKQTFAYDSQLWKDDGTYRTDHPDLDTTEAKLATFSAVSFKAVRLGMIDAGTTRWITVTLSGTNTLSALITGGKSTATNIGRAEWQKLVASPSLQLHCNAEGFNVDPSNYARARIGIVANEQIDCTSSDSFLGFGAEDGHGGAGTGNFAIAAYAADNGDRTTRTFGYVMVR